jgi:MtN3 and saliva related transmembrane protein
MFETLARAGGEAVQGDRDAKDANSWHLFSRSRRTSARHHVNAIALRIPAREYNRVPMSDSIITIIGMLAAAGTTGAFVPQVIKTWRTRQADDFSWGYLTIFSLGVALWLVYGLLRSDVAVIAANAATLLLVLTIAVLKAREH